MPVPTPTIGEPLTLPSHPAAPPKAPFPLLAVLAPLVGAAVLFAIVRSPYMLAFAALSPVIAVASTYIDAEENSLPPEKQLFADDVSRHHIGTPPNFASGNRAKLMAEDSHKVISAIRNRRWTVEGDTAWILYDGYLKTAPDKIGFYVAERITLEKGLIHEILVADITIPK